MLGLIGNFEGLGGILQYLEYVTLPRDRHGSAVCTCKPAFALPVFRALRACAKLLAVIPIHPPTESPKQAVIGFEEGVNRVRN